MARGRANDREGIRETRPPAKPGLEIDGLGEGKELAGERQHAVELDRRRRRIAIGDLEAAGEPDAPLHRRDDEAVLEIEHRPAQRSIAPRAIMPVITAEYGKGKAVAERLQDVGRPRSQRDDR